MNLHWLMRAKRWAQRPPSWKRVKLVMAVVAICIAIAVFEHFFGWPDALNVNNNLRGRMPKF
ncbi:hypothetical protein BFP76_06280 [Amylibacter kogurei]|uniref:Uncharacterized protein n=1 Tax=Paramylibacter kogurei TaxID=1889778 RepID=A0A2G5K5H6_9RHOB|nr:hypothetical protein [Amylibacter kogurei]PIB24781.1 hypothetical protein BFP76_06280 [Amylibacter kogurei]